MQQTFRNKAFTLMEILVVIVILGAIAGFAIPNFTRTIERSHENDAILQLEAIHSANKIYQARNNAYWPPDTASYDITSINTNLGLNIIANDMTYTCLGTDGSTFFCKAVRNAPAASFTVSVTEADLSSSNPACTAGACP
jgi:prepilin-type N-terminal cleavage/methylation domain-containing protein